MEEQLQHFRLWRKIERGEFIIVTADCSQGGIDNNTASFLSKNKIDFPITYKRNGVANDMTDDLFPVLEWICDITGILPVVAFERNNGGASEMSRLDKLNMKHKYRIYTMVRPSDAEGDNETKILGWITDSASRPQLVKDWRYAFDNHLPKLYDPEFVEEHKTFIINNQGKPEAAKGFHDDCVFAPAIAWQLYGTEEPTYYEQEQTYMPVYQPRDSVIGI